MSSNINVTIWNEFRHERNNPGASRMYPKGLHTAIAEGIASPDFNIRFATLDEPEHGLTDEVLASTDVLLWWGHAAHNEVNDEIVQKVQQKIWDGMGLIVLHSGHMSKIFRVMNGTSGKLHWREAAERERIWCIEPAHPIASGIPENFVIENEEMYGEPFMVAHDALPVFISWFEGGEVFRSGLTLQRGNGKIFYFRPGHETYPSFYNEYVLKIISNAIRWAKPTIMQTYPQTHRPESLEPLSEKSVQFISAGIIKT